MSDPLEMSASRSAVTFALNEGEVLWRGLETREYEGESRSLGWRLPPPRGPRVKRKLDDIGRRRGLKFLFADHPGVRRRDQKDVWL